MSSKARERRDKILAILATRTQAELIFRCKHIAKLVGTRVSIKTIQKDVRLIRGRSGERAGSELARDGKA